MQEHGLFALEAKGNESTLHSSVAPDLVFTGPRVNHLCLRVQTRPNPAE